MPEGVGYGSNIVASTGLELNVVGSHAYADSGLIQVNTSAVTQLQCTTGGFLFKGDLTVFGISNPSAVDPGGTTVAEIKINGIGAFNVKLSTTEEDMPTTATVPFIIPAYTEVIIQITGDTGSAGYTTGASVVGTIYK